MVSVQQIAAGMSRDAAQQIARSFCAMPAEKQTWQPLDVGRSALSQVQECAVINAWFASILRDRVVPPLDQDAYAAAMAEIETPDKALAALEKNTAVLVSAIEALPNELLGDKLILPFGEGMEMTLAEVQFAAYWNMVYHVGQIAYVQTLYGDKQMH